jgi:hypothetical protein
MVVAFSPIDGPRTCRRLDLLSLSIARHPKPKQYSSGGKQLDREKKKIQRGQGWSKSQGHQGQLVK